MIGKKSVVALATLLLLCCSMICVSAGHLKAHGAAHHSHHHSQKSVHKHHGKASINTDTGDSESRVYLRNNFNSIYAACIFTHTHLIGADTYSIAFFDQEGKLLEKFCDELRQFSIDTIKPFSKNFDAWTNKEIDDVSKCYLHENEQTNAVDLMGSYRCQ